MLRVRSSVASREVVVERTRWLVCHTLGDSGERQHIRHIVVEVVVDNTAVVEGAPAGNHTVVEEEDSRDTAVVVVVTDSTVGAGTAVEEEDHIHHRYSPRLDMPTSWSVEVM